MSGSANLGAALGRLLGRRVSGDKLTVAAMSAARTTLRSVGRVLHVLFLEVTGFVFLCLALIGFAALRREYAAYAAGTIGPSRPIMAGLFFALFVWFGISNFWRSRRKR